MVADDFQDKLNRVLSNPELMKTIASLAGNAGNSVAPSASDENVDFQQGLQGREIAPDIVNIMNNLGDGSDSRINLLYALKPYMSSGRASHMDTAIKILKLTKLTTLL